MGFLFWGKHKNEANSTSLVAKNNLVKSDAVIKVHSGFMEDENGVFKVGGEPITDEELSTVMEMSLERTLRNNQHYCNCFEDILPPDNGNNKLNDAEVKFMKEFYNQLLSNNIKPYIYTGRMGSGTLDVYYKGTPIGRVNLIRDKYWMQYRVGQYGNCKDLYGSIEEIIPYINKWIRYIKNYL